MSDFAAEVARIADACEGPTLRLINHKWAAFVLAVLRSAYGAHTKQVDADRLHHQVDSYLDELHDLGYQDLPAGPGRDLCRQWREAGWLRRDNAKDTDGEIYELTSHTLAAQRVVDNLARDRALLSESRLTTILDTVRRWAMEANPDRDSKIGALDRQIAQLQHERNRLNEGGELQPATDDRMLEGYLDVADLLNQLPGDFRRVEEQVEHIRHQMVQDFRADYRPKGEVLDDYLAASDHLIARTDEGRAFEGALAVLDDAALLEEFEGNLRTMMGHPFTEAMKPRERREFLDAAKVLRTGLWDVQKRQIRASQSLQEHLTRHSLTQERELTQVLQHLDDELHRWMATARPRDTVPMPWMPDKLDLDHLHTRFHDPASERPIPALEDDPDDPEPLSLEQVRRFGGPLFHDVQAALAAALRTGELESLWAAFNSFDDTLRRPVELFGLLQLAANHGLLDNTADGTEVVDTIRPDGSRRSLLVPPLPAAGLDLEGPLA